MPTNAQAQRVTDLIAAANAILDATPDPEWWSMTPLEVVEFAFPDWAIVSAIDNRPRPVVYAPRVLLTHRRQPGQWLLIWASGQELLPGRGSTMGQFFRFKTGYRLNEFAVGTVDEVFDALCRRFHPDARRSGLFDWVIEQLPGERADAERMSRALDESARRC